MDNSRRFLPAVSYRREARRLRARHSTDPGRLYGALRELAREQDRQSNEIDETTTPRMRLVNDTDAAPPPRRDVWAEEQFLAEIRSNVQDGLLRYSQRQMLLVRADGLGLHRFRANLLLAMALHELNAPTPVRVKRSTGIQWVDTVPRPSEQRLKIIGLLDLLMALVFASSLFAGGSFWPPINVWDYVALGSGSIVFGLCPVLFWRIHQASENQ